MKKIIGRYYAEYEHGTRQWAILRQTDGKSRKTPWGTMTPIRYPVVVKLWFPRWVSCKLLRRRAVC